MKFLKVGELKKFLKDIPDEYICGVKYDNEQMVHPLIKATATKRDGSVVFTWCKIR